MQTPSRQRGFTVVELLIVIVVIGILAAITIISYNGARERGMTANVISDLNNAQDTMEIDAIHSHEYPTTLPTDIQTSPSVTLSLETNPVLPYYSGLDPVQNAVLFYQLCNDLVTEGKGQAPSGKGGTDYYITDCGHGSGNMNSNYLQVNGMTDTQHKFTVPVNVSDYNQFVASIPSGGNAHPNQQSTAKAFYNTLRDRFLTEGGTLPITTFWDDKTVLMEDLPSPDPSASYANTYCIEADYTGNKIPAWHVIQDGHPSIGGC